MLVNRSADPPKFFSVRGHSPLPKAQAMNKMAARRFDPVSERDLHVHR